MCLQDSNTDIATELTLFPLSFKSAMIKFISSGVIGDIKNDCCILSLSLRYEEALRSVGGILDANC